MKKYVLLFFFITQNLISQIDSATSFIKPEFPGGRKAFYSYLNEYLTYPIIERERGNAHINLTATIFVSKEGKIKFVNVIGSSAEAKNQVKRVLTLMPDWIPAKRNKIPVDTFVTQKIYFSFDESRTKKDSTIFELVVYMTVMSEKEISDENKIIKEKHAQRMKANDLYDRAVKELNNNNYSEAIRLLNDSKQKGNESINLYFNLGLAYLKAGEKLKACPNFAEAARKGDEEAFGVYVKMCK